MGQMGVNNFTYVHQPSRLQESSWRRTSPKREGQGSPTRSVWGKIEQALALDRLSEAYQLAIHCPDDAVIIRLMTRTGLCLAEMSAETVNLLTQRILSVLTTKSFVSVLLPWITQLSELLHQQNSQLNGQGQLAQTLESNLVGDLIEILIALNKDRKSGIESEEKEQITKICDNLIGAYKF